MTYALLGLMLALIAVLRALRPRLGAEGSRKALHVLMGLALVSLPALSLPRASVWGLALGATGLLVGLRAVPAARRRWGCVLHDVGRRSWGDLCYPVAALFAYEFAGDESTYAAAVLTLALADPAAALVGQRWPWQKYTVPGGSKSVAGGAAFLGVSVLIGVPLLGWPVGCAVAAAATATEGLSGRGLDNLTVPLAVVGAAVVPVVGLPLGVLWMGYVLRPRRAAARHLRLAARLGAEVTRSARQRRPMFPSATTSLPAHQPESHAYHR